MKVTLDYETRSRVTNLSATGPWPYAEDPSTDIMCLSIKQDDQPTRFWANPSIYKSVNFPQPLKILGLSSGHVVDILNRADIIEAHNAGFERAITSRVAIDKYHWPISQGWEKKLRCTASRAAAMALPRSLDKLGAALGLSVQKDAEGKAVMLKLCAPDKNTQQWNEDPSLLIHLVTYCIRDTDTEYEVSNVLNELHPFELQLWQLDQEINALGVPIDMNLVNSIVTMIKKYENRALPQMAEITNGEVGSPKQVKELVAWCNRRGYSLADAKAETVAKALQNPGLPPEVRGALEFRQALGKSSTSKFTAMINGASYDGRVRDTMMFHGASTGRWSGKRVQPHNFPRKSLKQTTDFYRSIIKAGRLDVIEALYPTNPMDVFSACLRPAICAPSGYELMAADFNAIEGRCLAWEAGDEHILEDYRAGLDPYKRVAAIIFGVPYEAVTSEQRQYGKIAELACGYRGSVGAARRFGAKGEDSEIKEKYITPWRNNRLGTVQFWADVESCALAAVQDDRNNSYRCRIVSFGMHKNVLYCRLPSGRLLAFNKPETHWIGAIKFKEDDNIFKTPLVSAKDIAEYELELIRSKRKKSGQITDEDWAMTKLTVTIEGSDNNSGNMIRKPIHGGVWTENITQAVARDVLAYSMMRVAVAGYKIILHIHDEIVVEVPKGSANLDEFIRLLTVTPRWAPGLPLGAEGWVNEYLVKEKLDQI